MNGAGMVGINCKHCGKSLYGIGFHTNRKYCSDHCRMAYGRKHTNEIKRKSVYHLLCANCGKAFEGYSRDRIYCSMACYQEMRYVKKERPAQIIDVNRCSQDERIKRHETIILKQRGENALRGEVLALRKSGLSYQEIAKKLEISRNTVKSWVRRYGEHEKKKETVYVVTGDKIVATCSMVFKNEDILLDTVEV